MDEYSPHRKVTQTLFCSLLANLQPFFLSLPPLPLFSWQFNWKWQVTKNMTGYISEARPATLLKEIFFSGSVTCISLVWTNLQWLWQYYRFNSMSWDVTVEYFELGACPAWLDRCGKPGQTSLSSGINCRCQAAKAKGNLLWWGREREKERGTWICLFKQKEKVLLETYELCRAELLTYWSTWAEACKGLKMLQWKYRKQNMIL